MKQFAQSVYRLIVETSTNLPLDVRKAIIRARELEDQGTRSALSLSTIAENIQMAEQHVSPICQDTGMPTFVVQCPIGANQIVMREQILEAVKQATKDGKLRENSVDSLTGKNSGDNSGPGMPVIQFEQWEKNTIEIKLILKGGGCENKNIQYSLPTPLPGLGTAGRDIDGIRKCILHAVYQAQGQGCSAGFIGVGIGGDRTSGYELAKQQLFRHVDDVNPHEQLRELEQYVMDNANKLGIGTMGFGGQVSLLGCKIGVINRLPASFYVSVAYNCWAYRRQGVRLNSSTGEITDWLYPRGYGMDPQQVTAVPQEQIKAQSHPRQITLTTPISEEQIRQLKVGDVVKIEGLIHTGRDALHKYLMTNDAPVDLNGAVLYHCGPVALKDEQGNWNITAAGPTTSFREEPYQADIIKKFGIRAVVGKGGMGSRTLAALQEHGGVYLNAIGGAAQYYARCIQKIEGVDFLQFGVPEAMWHLQVEGFAAVVTMDAHGNSLHADVEKDSLEKLSQFKEPVFS